MKIAVEKGRAVKKDLKMGICGEHGGEAKSVEFCHNIGLDYVSCSPFRVPIARFAAALAVLKEKAAQAAAKKPAKKAAKKVVKKIAKKTVKKVAKKTAKKKK
jgi:pyruvate,orthophosphate dikinase